jgi:hypothetical protein
VVTLQGDSRIFTQPLNKALRSGMQTDATRKHKVRKPKNSFKKLDSERFFIFLIKCNSFRISGS